MTSDPIGVSVLIPCRNEARHIRSCVASALAQEDPGCAVEYLVVDGGSTDGTRAILEEYARREPRLRVIDNPRRIVSTGLNAGIRAARGEIIIRMDAHTIYGSDYVKQCVKTLESTGADNVGGAARTEADTYFQSANALAYRSPFSAGGARFHDPAYEGWVDTVTYGCWRKQTLLRLGLFDETLVRNQDDELNLRLVRSGGRIWQAASIRSWYYPRSSLGGLTRQYVQYGYWKVVVIRKRGRPASIRHLVPGCFVGLVILLLALSPFYGLARLALFTLLAAYAFANVGAALAACWRCRHWKYLPVMPLVFAAYHFGYGLGFLSGIVDFVLVKRQGRPAFETMSR